MSTLLCDGWRRVARSHLAYARALVAQARDARGAPAASAYLLDKAAVFRRSAVSAAAKGLAPIVLPERLLDQVDGCSCRRCKNLEACPSCGRIKLDIDWCFACKRLVLANYREGARA